MKLKFNLYHIKVWQRTISCSLLLLLSSSYCTFGSEGNSLTEKKIIINRLSLLRESIKTNASLQILFYDDQGDESLKSFQLNSAVASDIYTVTLNNSSQISFDKVELYISTTSSSINSSDATNQVMLHEADSGSSSSASATIKVFTTANGYSTSSFLNANGSDEFGYSNISENFVLSDLPQGILQKVTFHFNSVHFSGTISGDNKTKNFTLQFSKIDIPFTRLCTTNLGLNQNLNLKMALKYSELWKDTTTNSYTIIDNTKILRAITDLTESNPIISSSENSGIYNEILKNWNLNTTIKEHGCRK